MFWSCSFSGLGKLENPENGRFVGMAHGGVVLAQNRTSKGSGERPRIA